MQASSMQRQYGHSRPSSKAQAFTSRASKIVQRSRSLVVRAAAQQTSTDAVSRRDALLTLLAATSAPLLVGAVKPQQALAFTPPPPGYRVHVDKLDGYSFLYPEDWLPITSSGNDIFLRNPRAEENVFVDITSPSSSRYNSVSDLGSPSAAAGAILERYLTKEFMSTRLGIRREGEVVAAEARTGDDGKQYYDITIRMRSYASRNPYTASNAEVLAAYGLEWDRTLSTVLGVANRRLYELRLQTPTPIYTARKGDLSTIMRSFKCVEVEV